MIRTKLTDAQAKAIIDKVMPDLVNEDPQLYSEVWTDVVEAGSQPSFTEAAARLVSYGEELIVELQRVYPWVPSVPEARILRAFVPNYVHVGYTTLYGHQGQSDTGKPLIDHMRKMCDEIFVRAEQEQRASVPGT